MREGRASERKYTFQLGIGEKIKGNKLDTNSCNLLASIGRTHVGNLIYPALLNQRYKSLQEIFTLVQLIQMAWMYKNWYTTLLAVLCSNYKNGVSHANIHTVVNSQFF